MLTNDPKGHKKGSKTHRPNMKSVKVKGIEQRDMQISESDRLMRNFFSSRDDFFPYRSTMITVKFPPNDNMAVHEYRQMRAHWSGASNASNGGNFRACRVMLLKVAFRLNSTLSAYHKGSMPLVCRETFDLNLTQICSQRKIICFQATRSSIAHGK